MNVTVTMTAEEFLEFAAWKDNREYYKINLSNETAKRELMAKNADAYKERKE